MGRYAKRLAEVSAATVAAQNADLLSADFQQAHEGTKIRLSISVTAAVKVLLYSAGNGEALYINGGAALTADTIHSEEFVLDTTRTWNVQTDDAAGMTCELLTIDEVQE